MEAPALNRTPSLDWRKTLLYFIHADLADVITKMILAALMVESGSIDLGG